MNKNSQPSKHPIFQRRMPPHTQSRWTRIHRLCLNHFWMAKERWKNGHGHTDGIWWHHTLPSLLSRIYCTTNLRILKYKWWHSYFNSADQWQVNSRDVNKHDQRSPRCCGSNWRGYTWNQERGGWHTLDQIESSHGNVFGRMPCLHNNADRTMVQQCLFAVYSQLSNGIQSEHCKKNAESPMSI